MFVRASECTVSISQQVRDTKKWGFFILHVSRIKVFLEIHIDFQKCTEHHIFIPFQNNPYVSFWLQKSEHLPWEQDYFRQFIYVHTRIHKYEPFHMTLATPGSFLRTTISEADITCTLREFLFYESQPRFSLRSRWAVSVWSPTPTKARSLLPPRARSLCIVRSYCHLSMCEANGLSRSAKSSWLLRRQVLFLREIHFNPLERSYVDLW